MDTGDFKQTMRHCAGAVALVTVGSSAGQRTGLTVTAVCSLSDDPPSLLVCVNRKASAHPRILTERCFAVNFLHDEQVTLALTFSGQNGVDGDDRFCYGSWHQGVTGAPLLDDAVASFDCAVSEAIDTKTHTIVIGHVRGVRSSCTARPLLYLRGAFHGTAAIRDLVTLGDMDALKLSWSDFS